ncbi:MAG TPA: carboxymuconolactone decarboxylase family protein [Burkholderiales bacterium]|nr:carboxymuconolactone decarboxylase family protein [Burkholderiales bacterium]
MTRVPLIDEKTHPELAQLIATIKSERGGKLLHLYQALLNSPPVAEGWLKLFTAIRQKTALGGRYRELAILRVALLNAADYEYRAHLPFALNEGVSQEQIDAIPGWQLSERFDQRERAVLAYTDAMTRGIRVPDAIFAGVRQHFDDRETVELTATIAGYNLVSRFLVAMQLE